jgi:hypothetical protein
MRNILFYHPLNIKNVNVECDVSVYHMSESRRRRNGFTIQIYKKITKMIFLLFILLFVPLIVNADVLVLLDNNANPLTNISSVVNSMSCSGTASYSYGLNISNKFYNFVTVSQGTVMKVCNGANAQLQFGASANVPIGVNDFTITNLGMQFTAQYSLSNGWQWNGTITSTGKNFSFTSPTFPISSLLRVHILSLLLFLILQVPQSVEFHCSSISPFNLDSLSSHQLPFSLLVQTLHCIPPFP